MYAESRMQCCDSYFSSPRLSQLWLLFTYMDSSLGKPQIQIFIVAETLCIGWLGLKTIIKSSSRHQQAVDSRVDPDRIDHQRHHRRTSMDVASDLCNKVFVIAQLPKLGRKEFNSRFSKYTSISFLALSFPRFSRAAFLWSRTTWERRRNPKLTAKSRSVAFWSALLPRAVEASVMGAERIPGSAAQ